MSSMSESIRVGYHQRAPPLLSGNVEKTMSPDDTAEAEATAEQQQAAQATAEQQQG